MQWHLQESIKVAAGTYIAELSTACFVNCLILLLASTFCLLIKLDTNAYLNPAMAVYILNV